MNPTSPFRRQDARRALSLSDAILILAAVVIVLAGVYFAEGDLLFACLR